MKVSALWIYPVKSCRGVPVQRASALPGGFEGDRRFTIVDTHGQFLTQRRHPLLATVTASFVEDRLLLTANGTSCHVRQVPEGPTIAATVWGDSVEAIDCGAEPGRWLSELLGVRARLVWVPPERERATDPRFAGGQVGFADGFPYLLTTTASLDALNASLAVPVPMDRFRPNIVVDGARAGEELGWGVVGIGTAVLRATKPCTRCVMVTTDQTTGARHPGEPLRTLAQDFDTVFGVNAVCVETGEVAVGDPLAPGET